MVNAVAFDSWSFISDAKQNQKDSWIGLTLDYRSHWPLHLIFSPDIIEKYNQLFSFLLPIKRVQLDLQWIYSNKVRELKHMQGYKVFREALQLR